VLAKLRFLRGTPADPFGYTAERRGERALIGAYEKTVGGLLDGLRMGNVALAAQIASVPEQIRGFGHVKEGNLAKAKLKREQLLSSWRNPQAARAAA
jgi:indolepyruvate ferredoxin oxidoreductase